MRITGTSVTFTIAALFAVLALRWISEWQLVAELEANLEQVFPVTPGHVGQVRMFTAVAST
jgi:hypothetical protein